MVKHNDVRKNLEQLFNNKKVMFLAYDQGLEHGPEDFNELNFDPNFIISIAIKGKFDGLIVHKGIAEKYRENYNGKVPLILKLNGKTKLSRNPYISRQICSVKRAADLGASAVGYTVYIGSEYESEMFREFARIQEEAHDYGLPVIMWAYPRSKAIKNDTHPLIVGYAARVALELGADAVKLKYTGNSKTFSEAIKMAKPLKVLAAGGSKRNEKRFLKDAEDILKAGADGFAVGRNIWQSPNPIELVRKLKQLLELNK